jgi:hypothetical protein
LYSTPYPAPPLPYAQRVPVVIAGTSCATCTPFGYGI